MDTFIFLTVHGLARGAVLAAFALSLVLIWRAARIVNFAQGGMAVTTTYIAFTVTALSGNYWLGFASAIIFGFLLGFAIERGVMRFVNNSNPLNSVIAGLGILLVLQSVVAMIFGAENKIINQPFSQTPIEALGGLSISQYDLFVFVCVAVIVVGLALLFTKTNIGLKMRAAAFSPDLASLLGVRSSRMITFGWALSSAVGGLAALLVIPTELGLTPNAIDVVFVYAFTVAVVGGLDSAVGSVIGGLAVGVILSWVSGYAAATLAPVAILALLIAVLLIRPGGIFSVAKERTA